MAQKDSLYETELDAARLAVKHLTDLDRAIADTGCWVHSAEVTLTMADDESAVIGTVWWDSENEQWRFEPKRGAV